MLKQVFLLVVHVLGGLALIGLAELFRRMSFIAPDWRGQASPEVVLSCAFLMCAFLSFTGGVMLIYEAVGGFRRNLAHYTEAVYIQRNRDRTWLSTFEKGGGQ